MCEILKLAGHRVTQAKSFGLGVSTYYIKATIVQGKYEFIQCISDFSELSATFILKTIVCGVKQTKIWASGATT